MRIRGARESNLRQPFLGRRGHTSGRMRGGDNFAQHLLRGRGNQVKLALPDVGLEGQHGRTILASCTGNGRIMLQFVPLGWCEDAIPVRPSAVVYGEVHQHDLSATALRIRDDKAAVKGRFVGL